MRVPFHSSAARFFKHAQRKDELVHAQSTKGTCVPRHPSCSHSSTPPLIKTQVKLTRQVAPFHGDKKEASQTRGFACFLSSFAPEVSSHDMHIPEAPCRL